jgi:hypothetical protein
VLGRYNVFRPPKNLDMEHPNCSKFQLNGVFPFIMYTNPRHEEEAKET